MTPGQKLREARERLNLTLREIEAATLKIATIKKSDEYAINLSRMSDFETKGVVPSIFRLHSIAILYKIDILELLSWYGIDFEQNSELLNLVSFAKTTKAEVLQHAPSIEIPVKLEPTIDLSRTSNMGRLIEKWGTVPLVFLKQFAKSNFSYGFVGNEDLTMYPLVMPGSFIKIDETKDKVVKGRWRSEYERPIYFVEGRDGFTCCWCEISGSQILLQSHPLSPVPVRTLKHPQEAEVVGQVVGVAMHLDSFGHD
jgi:transcriptional regulator with XRE-family HTH domain